MRIGLDRDLAAQAACRCNGRLPWSCHAIDHSEHLPHGRLMIRFHETIEAAQDAWRKVCEEYGWTYGGVYVPTVSQLSACSLPLRAVRS